MTKPMIRIHNTETDEIIDREMTAAEFKIYEADKAAQVIEKAEVEAKETQRQAILDRLGLTADEAKLLLG
jgi:hypothetical protein